jgi:hypothetical protein
MILIVQGKKKRILRHCGRCGHEWLSRKKQKREFYRWKYSRDYIRCPNCRAFIKIGEKNKAR